MEFVYTNYVSFSTGASLNTTYVLIASGPPDSCYNVSGWNETPSGIRVAAATTMPTTTTKQYFYMPANATTAKDTRQSRIMVSSGHNLYAMCVATAIVSGTLTIETW